MKEVEERMLVNLGIFGYQFGDQGGPLVTYSKCHVCPQVSHLMMVVPIFVL